MAQGLIVGYDVPYPTEYDVGYTRDGKPFVYVRKFERYQTSYHVGPHSAGVVGVVRSVRRSHNGAAHVTLRGGNGITFGVRTGDTFAYGGRNFKAMGFKGSNYVIRCQRSGQTFSFRR